MQSWTAHQSHDQATILFYVPRWVRKRDLNVVFGDDYIIANIQDKEPIVKARLAGRIDRTTSAWQIEKRLDRRRSRFVKGKKRRTDSTQGSATSSSGSEDRSNHETSTHDTRRPSSPTSSESSNFDVLAQSTDTLNSQRSQSDQAHAQALHTPPSMAQSMTLSDESGYVEPQLLSGEVRSLDSSMSAAEVTSNGNSSGRCVGDDGVEDEDVDMLLLGKLVTLHLDKLDGGIWPNIVSGPPPSDLQLHVVSRHSHSSLGAALSQAMQDRHEDRDGGEGESSMLHDSENEQSSDSALNSSLTMGSVASDDSTTVLAPRHEDGQQYDMDPTSLTLMGLQHRRKAIANPVGVASARDNSVAFEYFRHAWKKAQVPVAVETLVLGYFPLADTSKHGDHASPLINTLTPYRSRLIAALGGSTALARLYISYARLHLPSLHYRRPILSMPFTGMANNPFGASPRNGDSHFAGPLHYLLEAQRLDASLVSASVSDDEWNEAGQQSATGASSPTALSESASSYGASAWGRSSAVGCNLTTHDSFNKRRKHTKSHRRKRSRAPDKLGPTGAAPDQGLVFLVVSRAALLSVMVAGGMAVAGWWRRAAAPGGS